MHDFTPISAFAGGVLIGLASVWLLAANGRIAGVSGILYGMFSPAAWGWRAAFVIGLLLAGFAWQIAGAPMPHREGFPPAPSAAAGLLVGIGTSLGGGCTSGHGVCGLARLSARSLVAVVAFMAAGMAATFVMRHVLGVGVVSALAALGAGFVFGLGLWISGMANPRKVLGFLDVTGNWDASLTLVMAGAVAVALIGFRFVMKRPKPLFDRAFDLPQRKDIDFPLVVGAAIFGAGWGIAGYCPGPALTSLSTLSAEPIIFVSAMLLGGLGAKLLLRRA